jgi:hypothetical protein
VDLFERELARPPPTGRAIIEATAGEEIPCTPWGNGGCRYEWTIVFTESNWLDVTIERLAVRYDERGGRSYWVSVDGEWRDVTIRVPAGGTERYSGWVRTDADGDMHNIMGGKVKLRFRGTDAEGNSISGSVSAILVRPD